jgi:hypothetical protein
MPQPVSSSAATSTRKRFLIDQRMTVFIMRPRHPPKARLQAGLGVDQELAGDDDLGRLRRAGQDLDLAAALHAGDHIHRLEAALAVVGTRTTLSRSPVTISASAGILSTSRFGPP